MCINSNHFIRNYETFGTPIAQSLDSGHYSYENEIISPFVTISNLSRNIGLHLENHNRFDKFFQYSIERVHTLLNIEINDDTIKQLGTYSAKVRLYKDVAATVNFEVVAE